MRLTPAQRVHAICAFVVPVVLVLIFAPWPASQGGMASPEAPVAVSPAAGTSGPCEHAPAVSGRVSNDDLSSATCAVLAY